MSPSGKFTKTSHLWAQAFQKLRRRSASIISPIWVGIVSLLVVASTSYHRLRSTQSVTIEDIDALCLLWNDHIDGSALYRRGLRVQIDLRDGDPDERRGIFKPARERGYTLEEISEYANRSGALKSFVKGQHGLSPERGVSHE